MMPAHIDQIMDWCSEGNFQNEFQIGTSGIRPLIELSENSFALILRVELPGFQEKDLQLEVKKNTLTLTGELKPPQEEDLKAVHASERQFGHLRRSMLLPAEVMSEKMTATLKSGVLEVLMPKVNPEQLARKIPIKAGNVPEKPNS
jgi:HSP20 family protein